MPKCTKCNASVDSGDVVCPACGTELPLSSSSIPSEVVPENDTIHQRLLNANLLKIRGNLDGAIAECINALRIDPDNVTAHSLIGDIYRSQGKVDEALRWYRLALDISPNSMRDKARVDELISEAEADKPDVHTMTDWRFSPLTLWTLLVVIIAVTGATLWIHIRKASIERLNAGQPSLGVTIEQHPQSEKREVASQPKYEMAAPAPVKPASTPEHTDRETAVIGRLNASSILMNGNLKVAGLFIDPRDNSATITFAAHGNTAPSPQNLVQNSLLVAREAFQSDALLSKAIVRAEYPMSDNGELHPQIAFVGEVKRESLESFNLEGSRYSEQVGIFDNPWWMPNTEGR